VLEQKIFGKYELFILPSTRLMMIKLYWKFKCHSWWGKCTIPKWPKPISS